MFTSRFILAAALVVPTLGCSTSPMGHDTPEGFVQVAADVVNELRREQPGIEYFLSRAQGVLVFPEVKHAAAVVGVSGGDCVVMERNGETWGAPRFMTASGVTFGVQAGVEAAKVVVVVINQRLMSSLAKGSLDLGAGVRLAFGPGDAKAASSFQTFDDAYVFRDAGGVFAGVSLDGSMVRDDRSRNGMYRQGPASAAAEANLRQALSVAK